MGRYTFTSDSVRRGMHDPLGMFGKRITEKHSKTRSTVECPYCHVLLFNYGGRSGAVRVIRVEEQLDVNMWRVLYQWVPKTHRALHCSECKSCFTVPKHAVSPERRQQP